MSLAETVLIEPVLTEKKKWKGYERSSVRGILIFVIVALVPHDIGFYTEQFEYYLNEDYKWRIIDRFTHYKGWFFENEDNNNYAGYIFTLLASLILGAVWDKLDKKKRDFDIFYYWVETIIRYVLMYRMSFYAITKLFPVQMPFPTISQMNIPLGDFTPGKLYWLTTGAATGFEIFAGMCELLAIILLFFRRTVTLGALLMISLLVPILAINITYDAGVELTAFDYLVLSGVLLVRDAKSLWEYFILHKTTALTKLRRPLFNRPIQKLIQNGLKIAFVSVFFLFMSYQYSIILAEGKSFKLPRERGLANTAGFYDVSLFKLNGKEIPNTPYDSTRWQNIVFEKHNTISIKIARAIPLDKRNKVRTQEFFGNTGRVFYSFKADTVKNTLELKNRADKNEVIKLSYQRTPQGNFVLSGVDHRKDSVYAVLNKIERHYPLQGNKGPFVSR